MLNSELKIGGFGLRIRDFAYIGNRWVWKAMREMSETVCGYEKIAVINWYKKSNSRF
jgi:hypothetical protein